MRTAAPNNTLARANAVERLHHQLETRVMLSNATDRFESHIEQMCPARPARLEAVPQTEALRRTDQRIERGRRARKVVRYWECAPDTRDVAVDNCSVGPA